MSSQLGIGIIAALNIYYKAPTVVIVPGKDAISPLVDACAAIRNILMAAESLGIVTSPT